MSVRDDPVTGLAAWPGFFARLPAILAARIDAGAAVGLAIGEVDDLRGYIEGMSVSDARPGGHLAGVELLARLGATARDWLHDDDVRNGCLATFGGGEIVLVAEAHTEAAFIDHVSRLRTVLGDNLPRGVWFAAAMLAAHSVPEYVTDDGWRDFCTRVIGRVERALFVQTSARRHHRPSLPIATISVR